MRKKTKKVRFLVRSLKKFGDQGLLFVDGVGTALLATNTGVTNSHYNFLHMGCLEEEQELNSQKNCQKLSKICQKVVKKLSKKCQKNVKSFQKVKKKKLSKKLTKSSKSCQKIVENFVTLVQ
jgi:Golgi nucleoside diphosphatase